MGFVITFDLLKHAQRLAIFFMNKKGSISFLLEILNMKVWTFFFVGNFSCQTSLRL